MNVLGALEPGVLKSMLRRLTVSAIALGAGGVVVALARSHRRSVAVGIAARRRHRFPQRARASTDRSRSADVDPDAPTQGAAPHGRLEDDRSGSSVITAVVLVARRDRTPPLGIGIVVGLVLFQLAFVFNVIQAMLAQGGVG